MIGFVGVNRNNVVEDVELETVAGKKEDVKKFPLTPMGVLAHRLRTLDRSLVPPSA